MNKNIIFKLSGQTEAEFARDVAYAAGNIETQRGFRNQVLTPPLGTFEINQKLQKEKDEFLLKGLNDSAMQSTFPEKFRKVYCQKDLEQMKMTIKQRNLNDLSLLLDSRNPEIKVSKIDGTKLDVTPRFPEIQIIEIKDENTFKKLRQKVYDELAPKWYTEEYEYAKTDSIIYLPQSSFTIIQKQIDEIVTEFN